MKKAFTLIELIVAIAVIGILVAMVMVILSNAKARMRDTTRKENLQEIGKALEVYRADQKSGLYKAAYTPVNLDETSTGLTGQYMKEIPMEPVDLNYSYKYLTNAAGKDFAIFCKLESSFDSEIKSSDPAAGKMPEGYNYWVENQGK